MRKIFWWAKLTHSGGLRFSARKQARNHKIRRQSRGRGRGNDWPKEANNPRGIFLFTSREMPLELKSRIRYILNSSSVFVAHPARRAFFSAGKIARLSANFRGEFPSHAFSRRALCPASFLAAYFFLGANCLRDANFSLCTLYLSFSIWILS